MAIDMKALARAGARARIDALLTEIAEIRRAFPGLAPSAGRRSEGPSAPGSQAAPTQRKRKPMTAAQKKAVGERMKKYWSARKRAEKKA